MPANKNSPECHTTLLPYTPPYRFSEILNFLAGRAIPGVELITTTCYLRTVRVALPDQEEISGWIRVSNAPQKNALSVTLSNALLPATPHIETRVQHLFDLHCNPAPIHATLASMNNVRPNLYTPGTRVPGCFDPFEMVVRAVLGQQITVKAATTLTGRFVQKFGKPLSTTIPELTTLFPLPSDIVALDGPIEGHLGPLGIITTRAQTIRALAQTFVDNSICYNTTAAPETEIKKLTTIRGIGNWTARYIAMRTMGWTDAFLETDAGIKKALAPLSAKEMLKLAEPWKPWRSYASINLWNSL